MTVKYVRLDGGITIEEAVRALDLTMDAVLMSPGLWTCHAERRKYYGGDFIIRCNPGGRATVHFARSRGVLTRDCVEVKPRNPNRVYQGDDVYGKLTT